MSRVAWGLGWSFLLCGTVGCGIKDASFFAPSAPSLRPDITKPVLRDPVPFISPVAYSVSEITLIIEDPEGENGAPPSGVDWSTVTATYGSNHQVLSVTHAGSGAQASVALVPDGPATITWSAKDNAGNSNSLDVTYDLDRTPPVVSLTPLSATMSSTNFFESLTVGATVTDPHLIQVTGTVRINQCGTSDPLAPRGLIPGTVSANNFALTTTGGSYAYEAAFAAFNPEQAGTSTYCVTVEAQDDAVGATGAPSRNTTTVTAQRTVNWGLNTSSVGALAGRVLGSDGLPLGKTVIFGAPRTNTDAAGYYRFDNVAPGNGQVFLGLTQPAGYSCPTTGQTVTIFAGRTTILNWTCTKL